MSTPAEACRSNLDRASVDSGYFDFTIFRPTPPAHLGYDHLDPFDVRFHAGTSGPPCHNLTWEKRFNLPGKGLRIPNRARS
ncbi:MAG TPA: hypothetical protein VEI57_07085 [Nitrospirota bacterium]|nr:hypothetical protein [Nitrospirota bacterium]